MSDNTKELLKVLAYASLVAALSQPAIAFLMQYLTETCTK